MLREITLEGAWYAKRGGKGREFYTILHLPYTSMVLSYVLIGATLSPSLHFDRLILTLIAYFLGLGLSAHALNELHARHWVETLSRGELTAIFIVPLVAALVIGGYGVTVLYGSSRPYTGVVLCVFIILETFFLFVYNLGHSKFHSDLAFAFSWAALPCIISYYVNSLTVSLAILLIAIGLAATAAIEINLSRWCKHFRRRGIADERFEDGTRLTRKLIAEPEKALKLIVIVVDLIGLGLFMWRLMGG
jgi:hypothetical protein